ncbi:MAG TPA: hypothetical protein VFY71_08375 [Planctomycetota bacterium]|nr:hypothetical protein [Planctomycetota bacterium]
MNEVQRRSSLWTRRLAVAALALLAACSGGVPREAPQDVVARAATAARAGRFDEALGLLHEIDVRPDSPAVVVSSAQDVRLVAYAGQQRADELFALGRELGDQRGGLELIVAARAGEAWLQAGGRSADLEPLCVQVDRSNPWDGESLRKAFAARAERVAASGPAAEPGCLFCGKPACDMSCVEHPTCVMCPPKDAAAGAP